MFPRANWHQTLSSRYPNEPEYQNLLLRAGANVRAESFPLKFDSIRSRVNQKGDIHHTFVGPRMCKGLSALIAAIRSVLRMEGIDDNGGHTPHITLSYWAPALLDTISFNPVVCPVEEFLLVRNGGTPFHYEELGRWPLFPPRNPVGQQLSLFPNS